jgi:hypothetical protein
MLGLVAGAALTLAAGRTAESLLFGLRAADPASFAAASSTLVLCAGLASYLPARRAAGIRQSPFATTDA